MSWQRAVLLTAAIALIAAPVRGTVICRKRASGVLVQRDAACKRREVELPLTDLQGPPGPRGPVGPSSARRVEGDPNVAIGNSPTTVATMTAVAPGAYVVLGKTTVQRVSGTSPGQVECTMSAGSDADFARTRIGSGAGQVEEVTLALHLVHTFADVGSIAISCTRNGSDSAIAFYSSITIVALDTATQG